MKFSVVILAAGQGTRMRSDLPKVLHKIAGRALLAHVINASLQLRPQEIFVVYGFGGEQVKQAINDPTVKWCLQEQQLGTGHAVMQALPNIDNANHVLVLYGDVPLVTSETLHKLFTASQEADLVGLSTELMNPTGYGRIVRDAKNNAIKIVEEKDTTAQEKNIKEINTGILLASAGHLKQWLAQVKNNNQQQEYYLTDCVAIAKQQGGDVKMISCANSTEVLGVNSRQQLAELERIYQLREAQRLMSLGATLRDPARFDLRGTLETGKDVDIDINAVFEGSTKLGDQVSIGPNCVIIDSIIGPGTQVRANSYIEQAVIGKDCVIGPYARIRPSTVLDDDVRIGNFVEVKKSTIHSGSKVNHLSYIGDTTMGMNVNIGAGTITCNYDGANKHQTTIGDNVFIGSNTQLVAPVTISAGATIGAGSTITKDAPEGKLTLSRANQVTIEAWKRPTKKSK